VTCLSLFLSCKRRVKEKKAHFHRKTSLPIISPPHLFYFLPVSSIFFFFFTSLLFIDYYWLLFTKCFISKKKKIRACLSFLRLNSFFHTKERKRERSGLFRGAMMIISCVPHPPLTPHLPFHFFVHLFTCDDDDTTAREANTEFEVDRTCRP
jgi:hypothetical protein